MPTARLTDFFAKRLRDEDEVDDGDRGLKHKKSKECNAEDKPQPLKKSTQTYLDLGQSLHMTCRECGMCYDPSFNGDTVRHAKHHTAFIKAKNDPESKLPAKATAVLTQPFNLAGFTLGVYPIRKAIRRTISQINDELMSAAPIDYDGISGDCRAYFVIDAANRVVGFALVQPIQEAFRSRPHPDPEMVCELTDHRVPASIGISRIWVSPRMRSKGVAKGVLDAIRETFAARPVVASKAMLAFSQPTQQGYQLARSYIGSDNVLVYK